MRQVQPLKQPPAAPALREFPHRIEAGRCEYLVFVYLPNDRREGCPEGIFVGTRPALVQLIGEVVPAVAATQGAMLEAERSLA